MWTIAYQALVQGILQASTLAWVTMPPPGEFPDSGVEPASLPSPALAGRVFTGKPSLYTGAKSNLADSFG